MDAYADFMAYAAAHDWTFREDFLPEDEWMFGMPSWRFELQTPDGLIFAEGTRFGMGEFHYDEILEAMTEWDGLTPEERAKRIADADGGDAPEA